MSLDTFSNQRVINLESYKKNGEAVQTPVWEVVDMGTIYVRTDSNTWKVKRIKKNPAVRIAPSNMRGELLGPWVNGEAHFVEGNEVERVRKLFQKKYGTFGRIADFSNKLRGRSLSAVIAIKIQPS